MNNWLIDCCSQLLEHNWCNQAVCACLFPSRQRKQFWMSGRFWLEAIGQSRFLLSTRAPVLSPFACLYSRHSWMRTLFTPWHLCQAVISFVAIIYVNDRQHFSVTELLILASLFVTPLLLTEYVLFGPVSPKAGLWEGNHRFTLQAAGTIHSQTTRTSPVPVDHQLPDTECQR